MLRVKSGRAKKRRFCAKNAKLNCIGKIGVTAWQLLSDGNYLLGDLSNNFDRRAGELHDFGYMQKIIKKRKFLD